MPHTTTPPIVDARRTSDGTAEVDVDVGTEVTSSYDTRFLCGSESVYADRVEGEVALYTRLKEKHRTIDRRW
jgi:hypothetical protein